MLAHSPHDCSHFRNVTGSRLQAMLVALMLAASLGLGVDEALAADECGAASSSQPVVCDTSNYSSSEGNIFYQLKDNTSKTDYEFRLTNELTGDNGITGTRGDDYVSADDQTDDHSRRGNKPDENGAYYGGFLVDTGFDFDGDITIRSNADLTARNDPNSGDHFTTRARGISVLHGGESGDINVYVTGGVIRSVGPGIWADIDSRYSGVNTDYAADQFKDEHFMGDILIDISGGSIKTTGDNGAGAYVVHRGSGDIRIAARVGSLDADKPNIETSGRDASGILAQSGATYHSATAPGGDIDIAVRNFHILTKGSEGSSGEPLKSWEGSRGIKVQHLTEGKMRIDVSGSRIDTRGTHGSGIYAVYFAYGSKKGGLMDIDVSDTRIETKGRSADGIFAYHLSTGDVDIDVRDGSIETKGRSADGIYGYHAGTGDIDIDVTGGAITTNGMVAHGIYGSHTGTGAIDIDVQGGSITARGANSHGISVDAAGVGADGYRRQTVTVNGSVYGGTGAGAGVYLSSGGKVFIGPRGSVGAESGIAILAEVTAPKLYVNMNLAGRRVGSVLGDDWIVNNGGETTLVVNNVTLHDGMEGATGPTAVNGAWDVSLKEAGVTVDRTTDPWSITDQAEGVIAGRDFSAEDFIETYAARAALYEALPGFLLRLNGRGPAGERLATPGSPGWVRIAGGGGRYAAEQASVGAKYDFTRLEVEAGLDVALGQGFTGSVSVRHIQGSGDVSSPTGGGDIDVQGWGAAVGVAWGTPLGYYFQGRLAMTDYDVDLTSDTRGPLTEDANAFGHSLGFEAGRRVPLSEHLHLTPRVWLTRSEIDLDFTDAVGSRLSTTDADRLAGGAGLVAETERVWADGTQAFAVHGSVDVWQTFSDGTALQVSQGEPLTSVSDKTRVLLGLGGVYRWGRFSVSSEVAAGGLGSRDQEYAGLLNLGIQF